MPDKNIPPTLMGRTGTITIGIILVVLAFILGYLLFAFWNQPPADASGKIPDITVDLFGFSVVISAELRIVLLVMIVGLIGSYIHTTISFVNFTGNRELTQSWLWYYTTRPFVAPFLALIFYFLLRGGMLSAGVGSEDVNQYGILAVSLLVGLFSKQAIEKLEELFRNLFKAKEDQLKDKLSNSKPEISNIIPKPIPQGQQTKAKVIGKGFIKESEVVIDGNKWSTVYKNGNELNVVIEAKDVQSKNKLVFKVSNPSGDESNEYEVSVNP